VGVGDTSSAVSEGPPSSGASDRTSDYLNILSGTSQNVIGIVIAAIATFAAQVLMSNTLGRAGFGVVTVVTMAAFVLSFLTRAGTDMAVLRDVAMEAGQQRWHKIRVPVARSAQIALTVSSLVALIAIAGADQIRSLFDLAPERSEWVVEAAAVGLPFLALANVWLSASRGLKIMRYTLYVFWIGQPIVWILLMLIGWRFSTSEWMSVLCYSLSWVWAAAVAYLFWRRESRGWSAEPLEAGDLKRLFRYAGPRAPAALFSQLLFWTDLFVLTNYASDAEVGIYSAALRAGQILVLFLTSVSLMFSPFVADLHNRGETERLDRLFKALTRWTLAATLPAFLLLAADPESVLRLFGSDFEGGETALLILLAGQFVNVATGSVGFVLIMVGRTGWDLVVYGGSLVLNLSLAFWLAPRYGMEGAAIANSVTFALSKWARLALVKRFVRIQPYNVDYLRLIVPSSVALIGMWVFHTVVEAGWLLRLIATGAGGLLAYAVAYWFFGLTPAERRGAATLVSRVRART
jgi:O-antigen/teichoic acid export membrane protein